MTAVDVNHRGAVTALSLVPGNGAALTFPTGCGRLMVVHGHHVRIEYADQGTTSEANYDFTGLPLAQQIVDFLCEGPEDVAGGTLVQSAKALRVFAEYMAANGHADVTPRVYRAFVRWVKAERAENGTPRWSPGRREGHAAAPLALYEYGITEDMPGWHVRDLDLMDACRRAELRGMGREREQRSLDRAVSLREYESLLRALRLEHEAVRAEVKRLRETPGAQVPTGRPDPDPFVVFALYAALLYGMRADELNVCTVDDLDVKARTLRGHAPNKEPRDIPVDDLLDEAFAHVLFWSEPARLESGRDTALIYIGNIPRRAIVQVTSGNLNHRTLKQFYRKYHVEHIDGQPVLANEEDPQSPFWCDFRKLRNAAITRWAERESNMAAVQALAGHAHGATTGRYYTHLHRLDHARKLARALGPEAQVMAAALKNPIVEGDAEEDARLGEHGQATSFGGCASMGCRRANHCFECDQAVYQVAKRSNVEAEMHAQARRAHRFEAQGFLRDAENARHLAAMAKAHLERIDDFIRRRSA